MTFYRRLEIRRVCMVGLAIFAVLLMLSAVAAPAGASFRLVSGISLLVLSILKLSRLRKARLDSSYRKRMQISEEDERNMLLVWKASYYTILCVLLGAYLYMIWSSFSYGAASNTLSVGISFSLMLFLGFYCLLRRVSKE